MSRTFRISIYYLVFTFSHIESAEMLPRSFNIEDTIINVKFVNEVQKYPCLYNADIAAYSRKDLTEDAWTNIGVIMNMTAIACKDKWRNLRVVFIRHLKQSDKKRKPYYLFDEMQFLKPYLKLNFSSSREESVECTNTLPQRHERVNENEKNDYKELKFVNNEVIDDIKYELDDSSDNTYTKNDNTKDLQIRKRTMDDVDRFNFRKYPRLEQTTESVTSRVNNHSVLSNTSNRNVSLERTTYESVSQKNDPVISFLNSILPELNEMNSKQFKKFKRRVLSLIDDIKPEDE